jgi:iron complex transport system substrate-binding protein
MRNPRSTLVSVAVLPLLLVLSACASSNGGGTPSASPPGTTGSFPVTVQGTNGSVTLDHRPSAIVSLSPTATEDLFAIGAGDQVVAVDRYSTYPADAPRTNLSGLEPNLESIAAYHPDLVVYATETGHLGSSLGDLGIPALQQDAAANLDDVFRQIEQLGLATGHQQEASQLAERMRSEISSIVSSSNAAAGKTFYYELDDTYYSVTSDTFIGSLFGLLGLKDIADAAAKGSGGYPQLSAEYILKADPDLIYLADTKCCAQSASTVAARPGWGEISAVRDGNVVPLDDDVASRWGPRVVDLLRAIAVGATAAAAA